MTGYMTAQMKALEETAMEFAPKGWRFSHFNLSGHIDTHTRHGRITSAEERWVARAVFVSDRRAERKVVVSGVTTAEDAICDLDQKMSRDFTGWDTGW